MRVHDKLPTLCDRLRPDVAVVPECANELILRAKSDDDPPWSSMVWLGSRPHKGLGVFGFGPWSVRLAECYDSRLEWIAPVEVSGPSNFRLLAVWAMNKRSGNRHPGHDLATPVSNALSEYRDWTASGPLVVAGDLNDSVVWDKPRKAKKNHAATIDTLRDRDLVSAYHQRFGEEQGEESRPTMFWRNRTPEGPRFHVDYVFAPATSRIIDVAVGTHPSWGDLSDHMPITVDIDLSPTTTARPHR